MTPLKRPYVLDDGSLGSESDVFTAVDSNSSGLDSWYWETPDSSWPNSSEISISQNSNESESANLTGLNDLPTLHSLTLDNGIDSWALQSLITEEPEPQLGMTICYGMIYRASVQLNGDMLALDNRLKHDLQGSQAKKLKFGVTKIDDNLYLTFVDGMNLGVLSTQIYKALGDVLGMAGFECDAFVDVTALCERIARSAKLNDAIVRTNIYLYGPKSNSIQIGRVLSEGKVFLQKPDHPRPGFGYKNPHFLELPGFESIPIAEGEQEAPELELATNNESQLRKVVADVYSSLQRGHNLDRVEGNQWLRTKLLDHQQEGLFFMLQRETGPISPEFSLWKPMENELEGWFSHTITKRRSRLKIDETGGGILADEMGMGKTLSILALVTKTLDQAHQWATSPDVAEETTGSKSPSSATLVIVPSALLINTWLNEIKIHLNGSLRTITYHGSNRVQDVKTLSEANLVITTYHTLITEHARNKASPLHEIMWYRVVLDEAHIIRRQATTFYKGVNELDARFRWCLTGTPIQNRLEDVGALIAFIRIRPFDSIAMFRRFISIPFEESARHRALAIANLTQLLDSLCLRRTKDLLHLPQRREYTHRLDFTRDERAQYDSTFQRMTRKMKESVGEEFAQSKFGLFHIQLQLRILCNHGTFQNPFSWARVDRKDEQEDFFNQVGDISEIRCSACRQQMPILAASYYCESRSTECGHVMCPECLDDEKTIGKAKGIPDKKCPLCAARPVKRPKTTQDTNHITEGQNDDYFRPLGYSSKMMALLTDVQKDLWISKSIIFSSWTSTLDLVAKHLKEANVPFARIDGECPLSRRQEILDNLASSDKIPVLIMTTGTGAFGLNLTFANRVFLVEPQWNPSVENQAIARAQRLGQGQHVVVIRYMIRGTVEQEMESQQKRKLKIAELGNATQTQGSTTSFSSSVGGQTQGTFVSGSQ